MVVPIPSLRMVLWRWSLLYRLPPALRYSSPKRKGRTTFGGGGRENLGAHTGNGPPSPRTESSSDNTKKRRRECVCVSVGCCCCSSRRRHNHINNNACGGEERTDGRARSVFECMLERQHKLNSLTKLCIAWYSSMVQNKPLFMPNLLPPSRVVSRRFQAPQVLFLSFPPLR